ncbi:Phosphomethylpyrimidine kinase-domain-containing protein [Powellomyces hirtus]|nr:Phosphomethylpyrimidine kinase-domain-containing protein [Powellomyces hirtus]
MVSVQRQDGVPKVLTVAGSDSGGGAGIQADLKTFNTLSVYGTSVLTAVTAQNTVGVQGIFPVPSEFVEQQMRSVLEDIGCDAAKTGMLFDASIIKSVANLFKTFAVSHVVVDPVMISTSGARLLNQDAVAALRDCLIPLSEILTPNIPEAEVLTGIKITSLEHVREAARELHSLGCRYVLVKGGHMPLDDARGPVDINDEEACKTARIVDTLFDGKEFVEYNNPYVATRSTHGTGCTLSAAITAGLAMGLKVRDAVNGGIQFVSNGLLTSFAVGKGSGPLNHFPSEFALTANRSSPKKRQTFVQMLKSTCPKEWDAYVNHKFVQQIGDGTLPIKCFKHFIRQDYIFLRHYARANALASYREHEMEQIVKAAQIVAYIGVECQMHVKFCEEWGVSLDELESTVEATPNLAYTRYVLEKGMSGDRLDLRVALGPCLIGYGEIGMRLASDPATKREGNPYWPWIQNYAKAEFQDAVTEGTEILETLFEEMVPASNTKRIAQLCDTFRQATILEEHFWEMGLSLLP